MKRLLPALLGLSVLLTACPGASPPTLSVPAGASVLHGTWQGSLTEQSRSRAVSVSPDRVFELREGGELRVYRLEDGAVLAERHVPGELWALAWRPDGVLLVGGGSGWQRLDPQTLAVLEQRDLPARLLAFSPDGTAAQLEGNLRLDTRSGQALTPAPPVGTFAQTSDDIWRLGDRQGSATRLADGFTVDLASRHGNPCRVLSGLAATRIESLPGGGLAVGYTDSVVELRAPDGSLQRAVRLDTSCQPVQNLRRFGDVLAVATWNGLEPDVTLHTLSSAGETLAPAARLRGAPQAWIRLAVPNGLVDFSYEHPLRATLRGGAGWTASLRTLPLTLNTRATYLNEQAYSFEGTARLGGEPRAFSGTARSNRITLKAAASPPPSVFWHAEWRDGDGSPAGALMGTHGAEVAQQAVTYQAGGVTYRGELRRP